MSIAYNLLNVNNIRARVMQNNDTILYMKFTEWLQLELDKRNWNKADLARNLKFSEAAISHIFTEHRKPGVRMCKAIAKEFNLPLELVYRKAGILPIDKKIDPITAEFVYLLEQLSNAEREDELAELRFKIERRSKRGNERLSDNP